MRFQEIFPRLPQTLKELALSYYGAKEYEKRYGRYFHYFMEKFSQNFDYEELKEDYERRILKLVKEHPYYKNFNIKSYEDIPILTKPQLIENYDKFVLDEESADLKMNTSGTTGQAFSYLSTSECYQKRFAGAWYFRKIHNLNLKDRQANFFGRTIKPPQNTKPPFWIFSKPTNQLLFSQYHLSKETAALYLQQLKDYKVEWFHGYPSLIVLFANFLKELDLVEVAQSLQLKGITLGSENLLPENKELIESVFNCRALNFYAQGEAVAYIHEMPNGELKVNHHFSYVEFIRRDDGLYRIIGSQLDNKCMPFIRYDTGDLIELEPSTKNQEGYRIVKIIGRKEDYLVLKDGRKITTMNHIFKPVRHIREAQIVQEKAGEAKILINISPKFSKSDLKILEKEITSKLGGEFKYEIVKVNKIARTANGKLKMVISNIN